MYKVKKKKIEASPHPPHPPRFSLPPLAPCEQLGMDVAKHFLHMNKYV